MLASPVQTDQQPTTRVTCPFCNHQHSPEEPTTAVPCNVRAFKQETFDVWRCPSCGTIHCLDTVDLDHYYHNYPYCEASLTTPFKLYYRNRLKQLKGYGLTETSSILDYGCGANGLQVQYLQEQGYKNAYGYDPYSSKETYGDDRVLENAPFDVILLQDVIEHAESPQALLSQLNALLAPGGYIVISTPNADTLDLSKASLEDYANALHVPYHLHILTREVLENLGQQQGWEPVDFSDRSYADTRWIGLNPRATSTYQRLCDGSINVLFEPISTLKLLTSFKFIFYAIFGYWRSYKTDMTVTLQKRSS